ncbi:endolytic transglycosylase MltG [Caviibacter abscessus]|uniref:endolytic transglycosylase MltG n=1 Tax=Caviibacter abscessus TaxID=1766719 RepID=UPI00082CED3D|nr:endolytic transglycosylase MltG [Caviibacter abscessus]
MKKIFNVLFFIFAIFILSSMYMYYDIFYKSYKTDNKELVVEKKYNFRKIYSMLNINYSLADKVFFKLTQNDKKIKSGKYILKPKITKYEIISMIISSKRDEISLTIPEGFTSNQVLARIEALGLATKEEMLSEMKEYTFYYPHSDNFEGYLYPETYFFNQDSRPKEILDKILETFLQKFPPADYPNKNEFYNNLILASIVERETEKEEDKPIIAGIFKNRLKINMPLQSDATLRYELERRAYKKDLLSSKSKYNSYKHKGLTPTPISNPSYDTIIKTMNHTDTSYLYFFMYNNKTYYSKTHTEHLRQRKESGHLK